MRTWVGHIVCQAECPTYGGCCVVKVAGSRVCVDARDVEGVSFLCGDAPGENSIRGGDGVE